MPNLIVSGSPDLLSHIGFIDTVGTISANYHEYVYVRYGIHGAYTKLYGLKVFFDGDEIALPRTTDPNPPNQLYPLIDPITGDITYLHEIWINTVGSYTLHIEEVLLDHPLQLSERIAMVNNFNNSPNPKQILLVLSGVNIRCRIPLAKNIMYVNDN